MTQPSTEQQPASTRLRRLILNVMTGRAACPAPRPVDEATNLLDAHQAEVRAAVLREAADMLRRMAEEGR